MYLPLKSSCINMEEAVIVVVHVEEAIHLGNHDIVCVACLGGNTLESNIIHSSKATRINIEIKLIFETDRATIKKLKNHNSPIKLELYSIQEEARTLIGFNLISVRNLSIVQITKAWQLIPKWHKLNNVSSAWKTLKPEICCCAFITEMGYLDNNGETFCLQKDVFEAEQQDQIYNESKPVSLALINPPSNDSIQETYQEEIFHTFCCHLTLHSIKFNKIPEMGIWQLTFFHPRAETPQSVQNFQLQNVISETVEFENLQIGLYFSALPLSIVEQIKSENSVVALNGPRGEHVHAEINNEALISKCGVVLMEDAGGQKTAVARVGVKIEDLGNNCNSQVKNYTKIIPQTGNVSLDGNLAYKCVEELEQWKAQQKENFLLQLKEKEAQHLQKLTTTYREFQAIQEEELVAKLENFSTIIASMETAHLELKKNTSNHINCDQTMAKIKGVMQQSMANELFSVKQKMHNLQCVTIQKHHSDELSHQKRFGQINLLTQENERLVQKILLLETEMETVKQCVKSTTEERSQSGEELVANFQKNTKQQLVEAQNSKIYYKQEWVKTIREMQILKSENSKFIQETSDNPYLELKQFLSSECSHLHEEANELKRLKQFVS